MIDLAHQSTPQTSQSAQSLDRNSEPPVRTGEPLDVEGKEEQTEADVDLGSHFGLLSLLAPWQGFLNIPHQPLGVPLFGLSAAQFED